MNRLAFAAILLGAGGCGLIDSNIADFDLSLPEKELTVDTADWMLTDESTVPAVDCGDMAGVCSTAVAQICSANELCFGTCDAEAETCRAEVLIELFQRFELASEKPELSEIDGKPLVDVSITRIGYTVTENTLNVDSPELAVYIGPQEAMSSGHPQAEQIGTIPVTPAGTTVESGQVELLPDAEATMEQYLRDYQTPFNVIAGSLVKLGAGDVVPQGRLVAVVQVEATAGL
jgi:hypothetical protein